MPARVVRRRGPLLCSRLLLAGLLLQLDPGGDIDNVLCGSRCRCCDGWTLQVGIVGAAASSADSSSAIVVESISPIEVEAAQKLWSDTIVELSRQHTQGATADKLRESATQFVSDVYGYGTLQPVLFAPAEVTERQFRTTTEGAVSYFIGDDPQYPEDEGFAKSSWRSVRFENSGIQLVGGEAMAMGNYYFTSSSGSETKLEYTFGYFRDDSDGRVKVNLHHSSYPYDPAKQSNATTDGITELQVVAAQKSWGDHLVEIGQYYQKGWHYHERATTFVDVVYAYGVSKVLFKPTEALNPAFRSTKDGAISYFVGGNSDFWEDGGFALRPWTSVTFDNEGLILNGEQAFAFGTYNLKAADGGDYSAQYAFGYLRDAEGNLRVTLHHSTFSRGGRSGVESASMSGAIVEVQVEAAQRAWGEGIVAIGAQHAVSGSYVARASQFVDTVYAYSERPVQYKPAEVSERPFRTSRAGAISYFVGSSDSRYEEDHGFALKEWKAVRFANEVIALQDEQALAMGNMFLTGSGGVQQKVIYSMGYVRDDTNPTALRINLHHASYPYEGARRRRTSFVPITQEEVQAAQKAWGDGVVDIGKHYTNRTEYSLIARHFVDSVYGFGERTVLMRVTDTNEGHFRVTQEGAASYLIGRSEEFPNDLGMALRPWKNVSFDNAGGIRVTGESAETMGSVIYMDAEGNSMEQEHTMGYFRDAEGNLKLELHFVSWPYGTYRDGPSFAVDWSSLLKGPFSAAGGVAGGAGTFLHYSVHNAGNVGRGLLIFAFVAILLTFICGFALFGGRYNPASFLNKASNYREANIGFTTNQAYAGAAPGGYEPGSHSSVRNYAPVASYSGYAPQANYRGQY